MSICDGPGNKPGTLCERKAIAKGLCGGHYQQTVRGLPLRPLRTDHPSFVKLPGTALRVSNETALCVQRGARRRKISVSDFVRSLLDEWAKSEQGKR